MFPVTECSLCQKREHGLPLPVYYMGMDTPQSKSGKAEKLEEVRTAPSFEKQTLPIFAHGTFLIFCNLFSLFCRFDRTFFLS